MTPWRIRCLSSLAPREAREILTRIGADPYGIEAMRPKTAHWNVWVEAVPAKVGNILKQEMLALGGDAAVARGTVDCSIGATDVLLLGTRRQLNRLSEKLRRQPFGLKRLGENLERFLTGADRDRWILKTPRRALDLGGSTAVMGILNVTPDSFSDGGQYPTLEAAVAQGLRLAEAGADLLDIGGESSRPGAEPVPEEEEIRRVVPVIAALAKALDIPLSVDTTKSAVARAAMDAGAEILNDISALRFDPAMAAVAAETKAAVVLMHMRGTPKDMQTGDLAYGNLMGETIAFLDERISAAEAAGIEPERIAVDPGIGFGKSVEDNLRILRGLPELAVLGRPILMGVSRKSFIGRVTADEGLERRDGTAAAVALCVAGGAAIVRVHDVAAMKKAVAVADAVRGVGP